jgi:hypothetical protein
VEKKRNDDRCVKRTLGPGVRKERPYVCNKREVQRGSSGGDGCVGEKGEVRRRRTFRDGAIRNQGKIAPSARRKGPDGGASSFGNWRAKAINVASQKLFPPRKLYMLRGRGDHLIHEFIDTMTLWINLGADEDERVRPSS